MSSQEGNISQNWKTPNELIKLHRLKQKKKQLAARFCNNNSQHAVVTETDKKALLEAAVSQKRKNPFARTTEASSKKIKQVESADLTQDDSLFSLINAPPKSTVQETPPQPSRAQKPVKLTFKPFDAVSFAKLLEQPVEDDNDEIEEQQSTKHCPMDWSLKTRMRIFCESALPSTNLKSSQEASGLSGFARCMDLPTSSSGLDISPASRLHQATYFWQHPHLPWMTLFPRKSKANAGITISDSIRDCLAKEWSDSFRGLFQLLRARQCPYFYVCANTFSVLFRAAGVGGQVEMHALMSPTSRGMRNSLKVEGIEYTMPFKKDSNLNKSNEANSFSEDTETTVKEEEEPDDDDLEEEEWLESLGVDQKEIKKISAAHSRQVQNTEMMEDFSDNSLVLIQGVECQALFNFLLNAKSTIAGTGRLAGVPPTLLAPVAFPKATMESLTTRSTKIRMDGNEYFSIELKGIILPHVLPYVINLIAESKDTFSALLASSNCTLAFTKASKKIIEDMEQANAVSDQVFGKENLSDCGLQQDIIESLCRVGKDAVSLLERVCFNKEQGFMWS